MLSLRSTFALAVVLCVSHVQGKVSFASSYDDHMVLQQAPEQANVWGFTDQASPAPTVALTSEHGKPQTITATLMPYDGPQGNFTWHVLLPATAAAEEGGKAVQYSLTVTQGAATASIHDVLFGEVWVCSGQSNMAFLLENAFNGSALVQDANNHPELRYMTTRKTTSGVPLQELIGPLALKWSVANNISVSDDGKSLLEVGAPLDDNWLYMSAVCYLYGLNIHLARKVPVGLINTNWGGTAIQDWSSAEAMAKCSHLSDNKEEIPPLGHATHLFNAMISPLLNHTIKGVVWYQGESNGGAPVQYGCQQPALVSDWREKWHAGSHGQTDADFAFGICEIAPVTGDPFGATGVRWFQTGSVTPGTAVGHLPNSVMPNTFMAVTIDLGDSLSPFGSVHPRYKTEVGARLALAGRALAYGDKTAYSSPVFNSASASSDGSEIVLKFDNTGSEGLELRAMNISKKFDQGNWTGATPFEVCMPSGGSLKPDLHCAGAGALEVGGDLRVDNMTLSAATKWCSQNSSCVGFTAQASSCSAEAVTKVYFKKQVTGKNVDTKWVNYQKSTPCGILSRYEDWSLAPNVKLGPNGDSIILSGMTLSVAAVRYAWRSYPCEHLGCGVYAKAENLPPPAFWAEVK